MSKTTDTTDSNDLDVAEPMGESPPTGEPDSGGRWRPERPDPIELLFGIEARSIPSREPIVVCIDGDVSNEYLGMLETIAARLYRERVGGNPEPLRLTDLDELTDETRWLEAEDSLVTIALSDADWETLETEHEREWTRIWSNRVRNQLFAQTFGVLIVNQRVFSSPEAHFPEVYQIEPTTPPTDVQSRIGALASGFPECSERDQVELNSFSQHFNYWQEKRQRKEWYQLRTQQNGAFWDAATPDSSASEIHRQLKAFAVRALSSHLEIDTAGISSAYDLRKQIQVEQPLSTASGEELRPDVLCDAATTDGTIAIEAETLFAAARNGGTPRDTLRQTIRKYENCGMIDEVVILVDPLTVVTQGGTIASVAKSVESNPDLPSLTFASVDFTTGHLHSIACIRRAWRTLLGGDNRGSAERETEHPCCEIA